VLAVWLPAGAFCGVFALFFWQPVTINPADNRKLQAMVSETLVFIGD
jgi:hypothetical protein